MSENLVYDIPAEIEEKAHINPELYQQMYERSISDLSFWEEQADKFLHWFKKWDSVCDYDFNKGHIRWFENGKLNAAYNCLDRHLETKGDQVALIWENDDATETRKFTFRELHGLVGKLSNVLKSRGVKKGDRICIYMPMIPEAVVAALACARIGAVHSIVFGGFSPGALRDRILDSDCQVVITADEGPRGGRSVPLKNNADAAMEECPDVHTCVVVQRTGGGVSMKNGRDIWDHEAIADAAAECPAEEMGCRRSALHPLYIRFYRPTKRCHAHHWWLYALCDHDIHLYI